MEVYIHDTHIISPLGFGTPENFEAVVSGKTALAPVFMNDSIGTVYAAGINDEAFYNHFEGIDPKFKGSRIEKLMIAALKPVISKNKIKENSVLVISTTKGNIKALENNDLQAALITQLARSINDYFGFKTEPMVISNACVSGVMALSIAKRFIETGGFSDAYVVAADELTPFVVSGFQSFQAMSSEPCRPYDAQRSGVNLGEAAVAVYVSSEKRSNAVLIAGESHINDANHISGPSRTGEGLLLSIEKACKEASISANEVDYISAHGTATLFNDEMEAIAFHRAGVQLAPMNSFKGYFGHTLGASGLLETVLAAESLKNNMLVPSLGYWEPGTSEPLNIITEAEKKQLKTVLKTASGFGGSNSAMVLIKN